MDPVYGYQVINVEAQLSDQSSLLHWTRNMIALRKLFQVFGRDRSSFLILKIERFSRTCASSIVAMGHARRFYASPI